MSDLREIEAEPTAVEQVSEPKTAPAWLKIDPNGATVFVEFYPDKQCVQVDYDRTKLKTWDMIIGILEMGLLQAKTRRDMQIGQNIRMKQDEENRKQQEAFETQLMAQHLEAQKNGKRILTGGS